MTVDRIPALLEPIQERWAAATPGPWEWEGNDIVQTESNWTTVLESEVSCMSYCYGGSVAQVIRPEDRVFIAHAPTDTARLLAAVKAVVAECDHIDEVVSLRSGIPSTASWQANRIRSAVEAALRSEA